MPKSIPDWNILDDTRRIVMGLRILINQKASLRVRGPDKVWASGGDASV
jgi:hypothetical protein